MIQYSHTAPRGLYFQGWDGLVTEQELPPPGDGFVWEEVGLRPQWGDEELSYEGPDGINLFCQE